MKRQEIPASGREDIGNDSAKLRRLAEARLRAKGSATSRPAKEADLQRLLHELQVHQIELEMQNEELQSAHSQLEALLTDYTVLYDFAPIGYLTLDRVGTIRRLNLAAASLLGIERSKGVNRPCARFLATEARRAFTAFLAKVFESGTKEGCEVRLQLPGSPPRWVWIEACAAATGRECLLAVMDITERKQTEADRTQMERQVHTASEREQQCIGEDLREDLCQRLAGITCLSSAMAKAMKKDKRPESGLAGDIADEVHGTLEQALRFAHILQPVSLLEQGLVSAIDRLASQVQKQSGIRCRFKGEDLPAIAADDAAQLYRIAQAGLNNAAQHANASRIDIGFSKSARCLTLSVADNGSDQSVPEKGSGLAMQIMRYRSDLLGAALTIGRKPRGGTVVTCRYPLDRGEK